MNNTTNKNIINYIKSLIKNQGKVNFSKISKNVSHDSLAWTMSHKNLRQILLWNFMESFLNCNDAFLIIDDTIIEKPYSKSSQDIGECTRYAWSNKEKKSIKGINIVFLALVVGNIRIPIAYKIYDKSKKKTQLALDLLSYARNQLGLRSIFVLFDIYYSSKVILKRIKDYGWYFVTRIKKNRKVSGTIAKYFFCSPYGISRAKISNIDVILVRHCKYYLITNRLSLTKDEIRGWYKKRSLIEEIFRELKCLFHAEHCQSQIRQSWENHILLSCISFCFLEIKRQKYNITIYKAKNNLKLRSYDYYFRKMRNILKNSA